MKHLSFVLLLSFCCHYAPAQLPYTLSVSSQPYQHLAGGASINNGVIWNYQTFVTPIGFTFRIDSYFVNTFDLYNGRVFTSDTNNIASQFMLTDAPLFDKGGVNDSVSLSPITYTVSGTAPNRIFQAEISNAGFHDEYSFYSTVNDSVSMQVWLYEGSNIVELRYGPSSVTHDSLYYPNGMPKAGFVKNYNYSTFGYSAFYILSGNPGNPGIDSVVPSSGYSGTPLNSFPSSGMVYRFTPTDTTSTAGVASAFISPGLAVYPTPCSNELDVHYAGDHNVAYSVADMGGKAIEDGLLAQGTNHLDVSWLAPGIYVLQVQIGGQAHIYKFVKQ